MPLRRRVGQGASADEGGQEWSCAHPRGASALFGDTREVYARARLRLPATREIPAWGVCAAVGAAALAAYVATLAPGLTGGDAGELALAARAFSVAHPPGYPLYVVLGRLAAALPVGALAFRLNLLSAVCGAGAAALLCRALLSLGVDRACAVAAALLFAVSPLAWTWHTRAEVFALNDLLGAALLAATAGCLERGSRRGLAACGALCGLGLANHLTFALLAAPVAALLAVRFRRDVKGLLSAGALAVGTAGLLYLQLPLGAWLAPADAWGEPQTLAGLAHHLLRRDYGTLQLASEQLTSQAALGGTLAAFLADEAAQLGYLAAPLALLGLAVAPQGLRWTLLGAWLLSGAAFLALARFPSEPELLRQVLARFWLQPLMLACVAAGLGLGWLRRRAPGWGAAAALALFVPCAVLLATSSGAPRRRGGVLPEAYARAVLAPLPPGALLLTRGDLFGNALRYAQRAQGVRSDVLLLDSELLTYRWYVERRARERPELRWPGSVYAPGAPAGFSLAQLASANPGHPLFVVGGVKTGDGSLAQRFRSAPSGLAERWLPDASAQEVLEALREHRGQLERLEASGFAKALASLDADAWETALREEYWEARHRLGYGLLVWALANGQPREVLEESAAELERVIHAHPSAPAAYFKNAGIAYSRLGDEPRMRAAFERFLERAPAGDPDRQVVSSALGR